MGWVGYEHTLLLTSCLNNYGMRSRWMLRSHFLFSKISHRAKGTASTGFAKLD
ncbi:MULTISPECIES: hypothetical protein [Moorena]|uniref:Uncharacterized protein n=1 Tax=Moorena producens (strain JHB) TaxID=1454205 RepID=A0A9Q9STI2_MOOP1|nr:MULTISPECIES: hypothetical protein [Moorena]NEQ15444.1 hypothetical protein [Moorena sp. SIO3E2]NEP33814.1 hypothetical protein [Moorena sp. SIO3B2]NEP67381.1 hypothetical protein [Moorena sp. SIO3A5]NEQ07495.1 hypothetical protein [Moorena sp. SIO4E2]NER88931.1 hypothetical protein [Moorena sp. SIO3A2]